MRPGKKLMILFCFLPFFCAAQEKDITGLWKGTLYNDTTRQFYNYEIGISREKGKYSGFSHTWFTIGDTQYFGVKQIRVRVSEDGKIITEDDGLIAHNYPIPPNKGVRQLNVLTLDAADSLMQLNGPFNTNRTKNFHTLTGSVSLKRKNDFWQSSLVPHLEELGKAEELSFVRRERELLAGSKVGSRPVDMASINEGKQDGQPIAANDQRATEQQRRLTKEKDKQEAIAAIESKKMAAEKEKAAKVVAQQERAKETAAEKERQKELAVIKKEEEAKAKEQASTTAGKYKESEQEQKAEAALSKTNAAQKKPEPVVKFKTNTEPAADVALRKSVVQQTVEFSSDSLHLSLYDNGEIDGDTVSVLMNGQLILAKQGLGVKAIRHSIYIPRDVNTVEMVMYAETLGTIAPNTGLLVIKDGKDLYEIRFSGDLQKNAAIVFNRKKER